MNLVLGGGITVVLFNTMLMFCGLSKASAEDMRMGIK